MWQKRKNNNKNIKKKKKKLFVISLAGRVYAADLTAPLEQQHNNLQPFRCKCACT